MLDNKKNTNENELEEVSGGGLEKGDMVWKRSYRMPSLTSNPDKSLNEVIKDCKLNGKLCSANENSLRQQLSEKILSTNFMEVTVKITTKGNDQTFKVE